MSEALLADAGPASRAIPETAVPEKAAAGPGTAAKIGFFAMLLGMFLAILDIQIVASSLGEIRAGLSASTEEISWVQTSYLIAEVIMIPLSGFLSRLLSTRLLYVISSAGFTLMSAACAFANSIESMIVLRALQGFIGGAMIPLVFTASVLMFSKAQQASVTIVIGLVATMAPTLGPTLGGFITETLSWEWLFLINLLPGIAITLVVWRLVDIDRPDFSLLKGIDFIGLLLMALFLGCLEYVVEEGPRNDWLEDPLLAKLALVSALSGLFFFWRVLSYSRPIVDLGAFANRNFAIGSLYTFILGVGLYTSVYLLPLYLLQVRGYNALQIGMVMIVTGACQFLSAPLAGGLSQVLDLRVMLGLGLFLFGFGFWLNSGMTAEDSFWELFLPQAIRGASLMLIFLPINTISLGTLPPERVKNASGLYNLMRNLGGAIGVALINSVLIERGSLHYHRLAESVTATRPGLTAQLAGLTGHLAPQLSGDAQQGALELLHGLLLREAIVMTFNDAVLVLAAIFACSALLMPFVEKPVHDGIEAH